MSKKIKALIAVGGTGGHVFPGCNLAEHLISKDYLVEIVSDKRGLNYLDQYKYLKIYTLPSSPFIKKNILEKILSLIIIFYSVLRAIFFLIFNKPSIVFGMGGYASFPVCIAAKILRIKFIIYENNLIIGKANKYLLPYADKIFISYKEIEGIPEKFLKKVSVIGNIINKKIINFSKKNLENNNLQSIKILVLGGSQAAKSFAEKLPNIFLDCLKKGIKLKIYQHCLENQNFSLKSFYEDAEINFEIFNFSNNLLEYFSKVDLAITRSGSSILAELTNTNVPFISVPLPSSADNHQFINATFYKEKNFSFMIEEKDLKNKLFYLIEEIYNKKSILSKISQNQSQYSDKNVYKNIDGVLEKFTYEKN